MSIKTYYKYVYYNITCVNVLEVSKTTFEATKYLPSIA